MKQTLSRFAKRGLAALFLCFGIFVLGIVGTSTSTEAATKTKKIATNKSGNYVYFSGGGSSVSGSGVRIDNAIYKMNVKTGHTKKIRTIKKGFYIWDISCYKNYLYFSVCYDPEDGWPEYVCRMKTNGKDFQKLGRGGGPVVYNGKLYYIRENVDDAIGISRMALNGKKKKNLIKNSYNFTIYNGKIYYLRNDHLYSASTSGKSRKKLSSKKFYNSFTYMKNRIYTQGVNGKIYKYNPSTKKFKAVLNLSKSGYDWVGAYGGYIYYNKESSNNLYRSTLYKYNVSTGKKSKIRKFKNRTVYSVIYSNSKWILFGYICHDSSTKTNMGVARMTTNGTKVKTISRWYTP